MKPYTDQTRPELIDNLTKLGHKFHFLQKMNETDLRAFAIANNGEGFRKPEARAELPPVAPVIPATPTPAVGGNATSALLAAIAADLAPSIIAHVTANLAAQFDAAINNKPRLVEFAVTLGDVMVKLDAGLRHARFERLLKLLLANVAVYMHGPAGSGKSHAVEQVAVDLGKLLGIELTPYHKSFSPASQLHELVGIPAINGHPAQKSVIWQAWESPSVLLLDELDATPELFVELNAGLANGYMVFADGIRRPRHQHCYIIAAGNTTMTGATSDYTSRARIDKATIDRFAFLEWNYDESLELAVAGADQSKWVTRVQKLRKAHASLGASAPDLLITPRASINGAKVLRADPSTPFHELESMFVWRGASEDDIAKVTKACRG